MLDISNLFLHERNRKRVEKELLKLHDSPLYKIVPQPANDGLLIDLFMPLQEPLMGVTCVHFSIVLHAEYPFSVPHFLLRSQIGPVSLNDHRNLVLDILHNKWSPTYLLVDISRQLPEFIKSVRQKIYSPSARELINLGDFTENQDLYQEVLELTDIMLFPCEKINFVSRYLYSTERKDSIKIAIGFSHIIVLVPSDKKGALKVQAVARLSQIKTPLEHQGQRINIVFSQSEPLLAQFASKEVFKEFFSQLLAKISNGFQEGSVTFQEQLFRRKLRKVQTKLSILQAKGVQSGQNLREQLILLSEMAQLHSALNSQELPKTLEKLALTKNSLEPLMTK